MNSTWLLDEHKCNVNVKIAEMSMHNEIYLQYNEMTDMVQMYI